MVKRAVGTGALLAAAAVGMSVSGAMAQPVPATLVAKAGDPAPGLPGRTFATFNNPQTTKLGKVGFTMTLDGPEPAVFFDNAIVWRNSLAPAGTTLTGTEASSGYSAVGGFNYSPTINGNDGVWTQAGLLAVEGDPIPGFPGLFWSFASRPTMSDSGTAFFSGGTRTTATGTTNNRGLFSSVPGSGVFTRIYGGGDVFGAQTLTATASNFSFSVSNDGLKVIAAVDVTPLSTSTDDALFLNGSLARLRGDATNSGLGDTFNTFSVPGVNNLGNYIHGATTAGGSVGTGNDLVLVFNGRVVQRELAVVNPLPPLATYSIPSGSTFRGASINDRNQVAVGWGVGTGATLNEFVVVGFGPQFATRSARVIGNNDQIDTDGDGAADWVVTDLNASGTIGPGIDLADNARFALEVQLTPVAGGAAVEGVILVETPRALRCPSNWDLTGGIGSADLTAYIADWFNDLANGTTASDYTGDAVVGSADLTAFIADWFSDLVDPNC